MTELENIRKIIDDYDRKLVEVFENRLKVILKVLEYKQEKGLPILQPDRELKVFEKVNSYLKHPEFSQELESLYCQILKISRRLQSNKLFPFNIVLIGFMGSGKSSVGKELSSLLEMDYLDTDQLISERTGMTINEIFEVQGEYGFRKLEAEVIKDIHQRKNIIISCGGGVVLNPSNVELLKQNGKVIWLKASCSEVYSRLSGDSSRPLLKDNMTVERISNILTERTPLYEATNDMTVDTEKKTVQEICKEIIEDLLKQPNI